MGKYDPRAILDKSPNTIAVALFGAVNSVASGVFLAKGVDPSAAFLVWMAGAETALLGLISLFVVQPNTVTGEVHASEVELTKVQTENNVVKYLAALPEPEPPKPARRSAKKAA